MNLKGITILPKQDDLDERLQRDLILEIAKQKVDTLVFVVPEGHVFIDAISVDYLTKFEIDGKEYSSDFGILDDFHKVLVREKIPSLFINPKRQKEYHLNQEAPGCIKRFLSLFSRVQENFKVANITSGNINNLDLLKTGSCLRESIERSGKTVVLVVFSNLIKDDQFRELFNTAVKANDFLSIISAIVPPKDQNDFESLLIGLGATDKLLMKSQEFESHNQYLYFLNFVVNMVDIHSEEFTTSSIIEDYEDQLSSQREELIKSEKILQKMARATLKLWLEQRKRLKFDDYIQLEVDDDEQAQRLKNQRTGVFVSLTKDGKPRGTMGTINPVFNNIGEEIINNSIEAAFFDPSFIPVTLEELKDINIEVEVLNPLEEVEDTSELNPKEYGIVVEQGLKRGVVLPGIEGVRDSEEQLQLAKERAGITEIDEEFEPLLIFKFTTETF